MQWKMQANNVRKHKSTGLETIHKRDSLAEEDEEEELRDSLLLLLLALLADADNTGTFALALLELLEFALEAAADGETAVERCDLNTKRYSTFS